MGPYDDLKSKSKQSHNTGRTHDDEHTAVDGKLRERGEGDDGDRERSRQQKRYDSPEPPRQPTRHATPAPRKATRHASPSPPPSPQLEEEDGSRQTTRYKSLPPPSRPTRHASPPPRHAPRHAPAPSSPFALEAELRVKQPAIQTPPPLSQEPKNRDKHPARYVPSHLLASPSLVFEEAPEDQSSSPVLLSPSAVFMEDPDLSTLMPEPLRIGSNNRRDNFTTVNAYGVVESETESGRRDTKFYQPYDDFLSEYE
jgi:hypothetical protein